MPPFAKREIKNSFIKLLTERPISQITVKDIVEDCGVNRNSFYYHFQDIPSLLEEIIVEMTAKVIENLPEESTFEEKVTAALEEIDSNKRMIYHIYGSSNREFYEKQLMKICDYVTRTYIRSRDYSEKFLVQGTFSGKAGNTGRSDGGNAGTGGCSLHPLTAGI